jgi:YVTN family beta-propeller protein
VARWALLATLVTSLLELGALAYGSSGWGGLVSVTVIGDLLGASYGTFWVARMALAATCLVVIGTPAVMGVRQIAVGGARSAPGTITVQHGAGMALDTVRAVLAGMLGLAYLLALALSGHAAAVPQMEATSVLLDWLHLIAMSVWVGGMAAIALLLLPAATARSWHRGPEALLDLLDRFSPAAYLALATAAVTGMFNAQVRLSSLDQLFSTTYGRFLLIKLAIIAEIMVLSASHVFITRPRLRARLADAPSDALESLVLRLRIEPLLGALVLLCVALMGQTAPSVTIFSQTQSASTPPSAPIATPSAPAAQPITATASKGALSATLTIDPPAVGRARFRVTVRQRGVAVTDGQVRIRLSVPSQPSLGTSFVETTPQGGGYNGAGDLAQNGQWQADVLIRTRDDPTEFRDVPFAFIVGPGASFVATGANAASVTISATPGTVDAPNTFILGGIQASVVRLLSQSLDMDMGVVPYPATALGGGRWRASDVYAPMNGRWGITIQAQRNGSWLTLRQVVYYVPLSGKMRLLTAQTGTNPAGLPARSTNLSKAYNVAWARSLPYTALVTEMGSNGVRKLGGPILHTGVQAHGVDVLDGTPYAYVTNFGAEPGTVTQIDLRDMRAVRTFIVGLGPAHVIFTPDKKRAFVTDFRSNDLYTLDLVKGTTRAITFPNSACFEPHGIDISEDARTLYVACAGGAWIYTVDARTLAPERTVVTAPGAFGVAVDGPRHEVWVTNQTANNVTVIDERTLKVLATIPVGKGPALLVPSPDGSRIYVADQFGNKVSVIDASRRTVIGTIPVAAQPHGPDITADGKYVYVASIGGNAVTIIRTSDNRVVAVVPAASGSNEVAIAH